MVWSIAVSFVLLVFALQTGYAITNVYVADDLGLTLVQVGVIGSIYTWVFAIAQFASGSVLDRIGARRVLPVAASLMTLGAFSHFGDIGWARSTIRLGKTPGSGPESRCGCTI